MVQGLRTRPTAVALIVALALVAHWATPDAQASFSYAFSDSVVSLAPGQSADVTLYLREVTDGASLIAADGGLFSVQAQANPLGGGPFAASITGILADPDFDDSTIDGSGAPVWLLDLLDNAAPIPNVGSHIEGAYYQVELATLTITADAGATAGASATFSVSQTSNFITAAFDETNSTAAATFEVQIIPEPGTVLLLGAGLGILAWRSRSHRRKA